MKTSGIALIVAFASTGLLAQQKKPGSVVFSGPAVKISDQITRRSQLLTAASALQSIKTKSTQDAPAQVREAADQFMVLNLEFDTEENRKALNVPGVPVFASAGQFADVFLPVAKSDELGQQLDNAKGLVGLDVAGRVSIPPPPRTDAAATRGTPEQIVRGGLSGMTGRGVIIAIVDSGLDFRNKDFIRYENGKPVSRLLYLWDTTSQDFTAGKGGTAGPINYPNGASVGTVFTQAQLTADLQLPSSVIGDRDLNGHGTSCAGIAAGNGTNDKRHIGVAPDADIIGVRIGGAGGAGLENAWILNAACAWLDTVVGSKPLVISCSFGGQGGRHDGRSIEERHLSLRFPNNVKGRAICVAAGNEGGNPMHAEVELGDATKPGVLSWAATEGVSISLHFDTDDIADIRFKAAEGTKLPKLKAKTYPQVKEASIPSMDFTNGTGGVSMFTSSGKKVICDAYIFGGNFDASCVKFSKLVGRPGTASGVITVGSYDWNDLFEKEGKVFAYSPGGKTMTIGGLSYYSSMGPSRDPKTMKPDIVAPGQFYSAPAPLNATKGQRDTSKNYQIFNGTSAATPYVSGLVALIFQKKPDMTFGEVRAALTSGASSDPFTGSVPNPKWGYGKLDLAAARRILAGVN